VIDDSILAMRTEGIKVANLPPNYIIKFKNCIVNLKTKEIYDFPYIIFSCIYSGTFWTLFEYVNPEQKVKKIKLSIVLVIKLINFFFL